MKASAHHVPALAVSLLLHCSLLLPLMAGVWAKPPAHLAALPNSVAFEGSSIEVEAPTPELAAVPGQDQAIAAQPPPAAAPEIEAEAETETEAETDPAPPATRQPPRPRSDSHPRPPISPPPPSPSAAAEASPSPASAGADTPAGAPVPGTFGTEGLAPGVRRLGYAFTRAIPAATPADRAWQELPGGLVGTIRIELSVDENNRLGEMQALPPRQGEPATPPALERMVQRTLILLRAGQFALSSSNVAGKELLIIEVRLRDEGAEDDASGVVVQKKFVGATPGQPGSAYFRYDTGRVFEAKVTTMPAPH